jgi:hypothetical protein
VHCAKPDSIGLQFARHDAIYAERPAHLALAQFARLPGDEYLLRAYDEVLIMDSLTRLRH